MKRRKILKILFISISLALVIYYFYPEQKLPESIDIDRLVVNKSKRELLAYSEGKLIKTIGDSKINKVY